MVSFSRMSSLFRVSRGRFVLLRRNLCCVTSPGKLSSAIVEFVAPLRLWHSLRPPPMVGSEVSVQRTGARWRAKTGSVASSSTVQESQEREERSAPLARRFKQSVFLDIPKGGWSNQSVGTGRSPACPAGFCKAFSCEDR